jgi:hypothetical protein
MLIQCPNCRYQLASTARYCSECGNALAENDPTSEASEAPLTDSVNSSTTSRTDLPTEYMNQASLDERIDPIAKLTLGIGIAGLICSPFSCLLLGPASLVLGFVSRKRMEKDAQLCGSIIRDWGMIAGAVGMVLNVLLVMLIPRPPDSTSFPTTSAAANPTLINHEPAVKQKTIRTEPLRHIDNDKRDRVNYLASVNEYADTTSRITSELSTCIESISILLQNPRIGDEVWKSDVMGLLSKLDRLCIRGKTLRAPSGLKKPKAFLDLALIEYQQVCLKLPLVLDGENVSVTYECLEHMNTASGYLKEATPATNVLIPSVRALRESAQ